MGKSDTLKEKLRSILAQLEYQYTILQYAHNGVNFQQHLCVPEVYPGTGEREDEAHVRKVYMAMCVSM